MNFEGKEKNRWVIQYGYREGRRYTLHHKKLFTSKTKANVKYRKILLHEIRDYNSGCCELSFSASEYNGIQINKDDLKQLTNIQLEQIVRKICSNYNSIRLDLRMYE